MTRCLFKLSSLPAEIGKWKELSSSADFDCPGQRGQLRDIVSEAR